MADLIHKGDTAFGKPAVKRNEEFLFGSRIEHDRLGKRTELIFVGLHIGAPIEICAIHPAIKSALTPHWTGSRNGEHLIGKSERIGAGGGS